MTLSPAELVLGALLLSGASYRVGQLVQMRRNASFMSKTLFGVLPGPHKGKEDADVKFDPRQGSTADPKNGGQYL